MAAASILRAALAAAVWAGAVGDTSMPELVDRNVMFGTLQALDALGREAPYSISPNGTRDRSSPGHNKTVEYLLAQIQSISADLRPVRQVYMERGWKPGTPELEQMAPASKTYQPGYDYTVMPYSPAGAAEGNVSAVSDDETASLGCSEGDFENFTSGNIALVKRGTCGFDAKAQNAKTAGATGVLIYFLEGQPLRVSRLSEAHTLPIFVTSYEVGQELLIEGGNAKVRLVSTAVDIVSQGVSNIYVDIDGENKDGVLMVGAHLDSVPAGPGINDNGSGTALLLELLRVFGERFGFSGGSTKLKQSVRFVWWASEEWGLLGSYWYVGNLTQDQNEKVLGYINFDMAGSRNGINGIADAQNFDEPIPADYIQGALQGAFESFGEQWILWPYTGSDHTPFFRSGIPAGAMFSGATIVKDEAMAQKFGGTAGQQCDPCYHLPCDTADGIDLDRMHLFSKVGAKVLQDFAEDADLPEHLRRASSPTPAPTPVPASGPSPILIIGGIVLVVGALAMFLLRGSAVNEGELLAGDAELTRPEDA